MEGGEREREREKEGSSGVECCVLHGGIVREREGGERGVDRGCVGRQRETEGGRERERDEDCTRSLG